MIYVCKTEHIKTGKTHVFRTVYDFERGDIIYPWHLQSEYPLDSLTESQKLKLFGQAEV